MKFTPIRLLVQAAKLSKKGDKRRSCYGGSGTAHCGFEEKHKEKPQKHPFAAVFGALAHLSHPLSYRKLRASVQFPTLISHIFRTFRPVFDAKLRLRTPILHQIPRLCSFQTRILHPILHPKGPVNTGGNRHGCRKCRRFLQNFF